MIIFLRNSKKNGIILFLGFFFFIFEVNIYTQQTILQEYSFLTELKKIDPNKYQKIQIDFKKFWTNCTTTELEKLEKLAFIFSKKRINSRSIAEYILDILLLFEKKQMKKWSSLDNWLDIMIQILETKPRNYIEKFLQKNYLFFEQSDPLLIY